MHHFKGKIFCVINNHRLDKLFTHLMFNLFIYNFKLICLDQ